MPLDVPLVAQTVTLNKRLEEEEAIVFTNSVRILTFPQGQEQKKAQSLVLEHILLFPGGQKGKSTGSIQLNNLLGELMVCFP